MRATVAVDSAAPPVRQALGDLAVRIATLLPVRVDTLEVPHLLHKDEPFERRFTQLHCRLASALQKFRNRASSGNPVIYNCSNPDLCGRKILFLLPHIPTIYSASSPSSKFSSAISTLWTSSLVRMTAIALAPAD